jgi:hypothetical protein
MRFPQPDNEFSLRGLGKPKPAESAKESKPAHKTRGDRPWAKVNSTSR